MYGFDGYLEITGAHLYPTLVFQMSPLSERLSRPVLAFEIQEASTWRSIYAAAGKVADPSRGEILVTTTDCHWGAAPGITVHVDRADSQSLLYYPVRGDFSASSQSTDGSGQAIVLEVPAGLVTVSASSMGLGQVIGQRTILVRPGSLSFLWMHPSQ